MHHQHRIFARATSSAGALRSKLLRLVMPHLSGETGDALAKALASGDDAAFASLWSGVTKNILSQVKETQE